jgi:prepilin-type N-terminal cleavage/methylation domain-containing protein
MTPNRRQTCRARRGFTAIELAAVASIIAILALILVPIVRNRLEEARLTAALDDMRSIEVAQMLALADTGFYFRLSDLDNAAADLDTYDDPASTPAQEAQAVRTVPNGTWNRVFNAAEQATAANEGLILRSWLGPYITYNKTKFIRLTTGINGPRWRQVDIDVFPPSTISSFEGPIPIFNSPSSTTADPFNDDAANGETHPIDPWGAPYIFFGPGRIGQGAGGTALSTAGVTETNFGTAITYSTGPNGVAGNNAALSDLIYFRENGTLGTDDDLFRIF